MRESKIETYLVSEVEKRKGLAYKFTSPGRRNVPDRLVVLPRFVSFFVEVKAPGKTATEAQQREHKRLTDRGQTVHVVDSCERVDEILANYGV